MATGLGHQYTYYYYRLQNTQDLQDNLLNSYFHYIKWLMIKGVPFTASDLLYQLKIMNAYFIAPPQSRSDNILAENDPLKRASLNTLINTNLKNRKEYLDHLDFWNNLRSSTAFIFAVGVFVTYLILPLPPALIHVPLFFLLPLFCGVAFGCFYEQKTFEKPNPSIISLPKFDFSWATVGILSCAFIFIAPVVPGFTALLNGHGLLLLSVPSLITSFIGFLATISFINRPIQGVQKTQLEEDPDKQLKTQLTQFCQLEEPSNNLKVAVEATTNCLLHGYKQNMDEPVMDLNVLEKELGQKLSPQ